MKVFFYKNITLSSYTYTCHVDADKHHIDDESHTDAADTGNDNGGSVTR